ncbi:MAG: ABC-F family ATP-binding cassette domain-containing protein [Chloroflexi bacterium]|nr:ABC-F family ATP-binding cassette domain-containing protein [Chloroflexota bacterium]MBT3669242.1 ABC-F family ATP-binding cassette domain-containing protein [Chloroflexota bacterium]MBT4003067.1 ABC-F family ATP-binding cassette domain-containing protein [Chloroflexota bacterium]MBT4305949.1 ABC-F family ATP-binding cassette domain-containing protein [Chloroflexota bacterium]MBT4532593.1 ABC-F family ATP-binding cassette domain-containing protein [Chloroflexota bacterium]
MAVITVTNLSKSFEPINIFSGISFSIPYRARASIVGPNGIGKTALLRILADEDKATSGTVHIAKGAKIGYLPQEAKFDSAHTLWEECLSAISELLALEEKLTELEKIIGKDPHDEEILEKYGEMQTEFEHQGGYQYQNLMKQVLSGLGFVESDYRMPMNLLSGGQRTRALLAKLLLFNPDLLILDEPTNHLDIQAVEWLESYLRDWEGAVLIVSHDRYFLDRVVTHIYEMSPVGFEMYRGNYSAYLLHREQRWIDRQNYIESEFARMQKELEYIRKNISRQRTQQAKGKLARLSREIRAIEKLGFFGVRDKSWSKIAGQIGGGDRNTLRVDEAAQRLSALKSPSNQVNTIKISMRSKHRSGNIVLNGEKFEIGYPGKSLFSVNKFELRRQECAALIGPNGSGKTTFLKTILKQINPTLGEVHQGASLKIGYFAQAHEELDPNLTLIEEIDRMGTGMLEREIRGYLGKYLFSGEDQYKKVGVLSGGESGRLALAKLSLMNANFLLLDEPSNHLDIPAQEILQQVLAEFDGTILMVSHDRYLIDALATQVWDIDPINQSLSIFKGSYSEYKGILAEDELKGEIEIKEKFVSKKISENNTTISKHEKQRVQKKILSLEDRILNIENKLEGLGKKLSKPSENSSEIIKIGEDYAYYETELEKALEEWENLQLQINI